MNVQVAFSDRSFRTPWDVSGPSRVDAVYVPEHFKLPESHLRRLLSTPRAGNLVTVHEDGPDATLVPFWFDEQRNRLVTHLVRNNPQARRALIGPAMVVLDEADAYVSPLWYATNPAMPNVPTWDYITIHVWGAMHLDHSPEASLTAARALTSRMGDGESLDLVGEEKLRRMARSIVAVEVDAERIEGKAKMSQNRHPDDVRSLITALDEQGETTLVNYLREVSLPHAEARYAMIRDLRGAQTVDAALTNADTFSQP